MSRAEGWVLDGVDPGRDARDPARVYRSPFLALIVLVIL
jgi:hypothetical protein